MKLFVWGAPRRPRAKSKDLVPELPDLIPTSGAKTKDQFLAKFRAAIAFDLKIENGLNVPLKSLDKK